MTKSIFSIKKKKNVLQWTFRLRRLSYDYIIIIISLHTGGRHFYRKQNIGGYYQ